MLIRFLLILSLILPGNCVFAGVIKFNKVADTNALIPQMQKNVKSFGVPYIYAGKVVFRVFGKINYRALYTNLYGKLNKVVDTHVKIPKGKGKFNGFGMPKAPFHNLYHYLAYNSPSISKNSIAFLGTGGDGQMGIYLYKNKKLSLIANQATQILDGKGHFEKFDGPYVNNDQVIFHAFGNNKQQGLYLFGNNKLSLLFNTKTKIPDGSGRFNSFWNPSFDNGVIAFVGKGQLDQVGIYANLNGKLKCIVNKNSHPFKNKSTFVSFGGPSLQNREIAFRGELENQHGIYKYSKDKITIVVDFSSSIPNGKGAFTAVLNPTLNKGNVCFRGKGNFGQCGIYVNYNKKLIKIIAVGDNLNGKNIKHLHLGAVSLSDNKVAFRAVFEDKSQAIYIAAIN